jgi:glutaminase
LYETSVDWLYDIRLPGRGGLGTFAPPPDQAGNSVKGQLVAKLLSQRLGLALLVSQPEV